MNVLVSNTLTIETPTQEALMWCKKNLTIANPEYAKKVRMHFWVGDTPSKLSLYEQEGNNLILPFGTLRTLPDCIAKESTFTSSFPAPVSVVYGGKGVSVCEEWEKSFSAFRDWALAHGYEEGLTIDRIESDKDYCPENCRWVTHLKQMSNTSRNVMLTYQGETHSLSEWSRIVGVPYGTLKSRLRYGWSVERMLGGATS